jgi:hypothetical protein
VVSEVLPSENYLTSVPQGDIERCPHCGWQALGCLHFDPNDARRQAWNGKWPREDDLASTATVIQTFSIGCSRIAFGMPTRNGGSGDSERPLSNFARFAQVLHRSGLLQRVRLVVGARRHQNKRRALRWTKSRARQRRQ